MREAGDVDASGDVRARPEEYCREIEAYVCRKNDGHLIRIVGPAFERVCGWATRGVPLRVAYTGIDRCFERYYAKGSRRRPLRVEFCEADVLDAFDDWRRAVGIPAAAAGEGAGEGDEAGRRAGSLPAHLERVIARLTVLRGGEPRGFAESCDAIVGELDAARAGAKGLRGEARERLLSRLHALDATLIDAARAQCSSRTLGELEAIADEELAPFRDRMPREALLTARHAALERLLRERFGLPFVAFE